MATVCARSLQTGLTRPSDETVGLQNLHTELHIFIGAMEIKANNLQAIFALPSKDLKSSGETPCGFESRPRHHYFSAAGLIR